MLVTYIPRMRNYNLEIRIAYSSCCPQLTWSMIMSTGNFLIHVYTSILVEFYWILYYHFFSCWLNIYFFCHITVFIFFWIRISKLQDQLYSLSTARSYKKLVLDRLVLWICDCPNKFKNMKSNSNSFSCFTLLLQYCLTLPLLNVVKSCCLFS